MSQQKSNPTESDLLLDTSQMSAGQRQAMELAETSRADSWDYPTFAGQLFLGELPWHLILPFPAQAAADKADGDAVLAKLKTFLQDNVDPDEIDATGEIPPAVLQGLAQMGLFGIKIPRDYGGLGLSQTNYCRIAMTLGGYCGNLTALISAHQSIGIPQPLLLFGNEAQKRKYLPRVAAGEISAFALTEDQAGSDPAQLSTTATPTADGTGFLLNGKKLWCTNGTKAGVMIVMARTPDKMVKGKPRKQVTAFIVEANTPGLTVTHRCRFMGLKALYNAVITFNDVFVPQENVVWGIGLGMKVALTTLNTGRLTLPAACVGAAKRSLQIVRSWANERVQWGQPIGKHAAIADKIAKMTANTFAMEAMTMLTAALVDGKQTDIRLEAAIAKMWCTEMQWRLADETLQIRGGRGFETVQSQRARGEKGYAVERVLRDSRINLIFEGSSEIMRLLIAREALDPHLKRGAAVINSQLPLGTRLRAGLKAGLHYAWWYPKQYLPAGGDWQALDPALHPYARLAAGLSKKLARTLLHQMARYGAKLEREQMVLKNMVDVGAEIFAIVATCTYADQQLRQGLPRVELLRLVDYFVQESCLRIDAACHDLRHNAYRAGAQVAEHMLAGDYQWLEAGIVDDVE
jgi:alkylation response protein AidB-like acyl-CoA dehydrogenase